MFNCTLVTTMHDPEVFQAKTRHLYSMVTMPCKTPPPHINMVESDLFTRRHVSQTDDRKRAANLKRRAQCQGLFGPSPRLLTHILHPADANMWDKLRTWRTAPHRMSCLHCAPATWGLFGECICRREEEGCRVPSTMRLWAATGAVAWIC